MVFTKPFIFIPFILCASTEPSIHCCCYFPRRRRRCCCCCCCRIVDGICCVCFFLCSSAFGGVSFWRTSRMWFGSFVALPFRLCPFVLSVCYAPLFSTSRFQSCPLTLRTCQPFGSVAVCSMFTMFTIRIACVCRNSVYSLCIRKTEEGYVYNVCMCMMLVYASYVPYKTYILYGLQCRFNTNILYLVLCIV